MKKIVSLLLITILCFSLVACGTSENTETEVATQVATQSPQEIAQNKLAEAYETCCENGVKDYAKLGYDKMSLTIDTNPNDGYYSYEDDATTAIVTTNLFLELQSSLIEKMSSTRALDGTQTQDCGEYTVTWNYHPDNGLKVIYEVNP